MRFDNFLTSAIPEAVKKLEVKSLVALFGEMIFCWQSWHADPHPGNIYVRYDSQVVQTNVKDPTQTTYRFVIDRIFLIDWGGICVLKEDDDFERNLVPRLGNFLREMVQARPTADGSPPDGLVRAAADFKFEWAAYVDNQTKVSFVRSLVSSKSHTLWIKRKPETDLTVPKLMPPAVVQLLRVMNALGAYGNYVDASVVIRTTADEAKISSDHHSDGVWANILSTSAQRVTQEMRRYLRQSHFFLD